MDASHGTRYAHAVTVPDVRQRLNYNLSRVTSLLTAADTLENSSTKSDILRAAVVFLHATLEDVLRSGLELELPRANAEQLGSIPFVVTDAKGKARKTEKVTLAELTQYRGKTVDQTIKDLVDEYLDRSNFNNLEEVGTALKRMGIGTLNSLGLDQHANDLIALTSRRHWIVHRVDRNRSAGSPGRPRTRRIHSSTVNSWTKCVRAVGDGILDALEQKP